MITISLSFNQHTALNDERMTTTYALLTNCDATMRLCSGKWDTRYERKIADVVVDHPAIMWGDCAEVRGEFTRAAIKEALRLGLAYVSDAGCTFATQIVDCWTLQLRPTLPQFAGSN
jgi:hypothetical protein